MKGCAYLTGLVLSHLSMSGSDILADQRTDLGTCSLIGLHAMVCASKVWDCLVGASPLLTGTVGSNSNMSHCLGVHQGSDMCNCFEQCIPYTYFACAASTLSQIIAIDYRTCTERYVTQHETSS